MAILATVKNFLERNAEQLRNERGFWNEVVYVINQNLAEITPNTTYGSTATHFKLATRSLGEQLKAAGGGIKHVLWDERKRFVIQFIKRSRVENPVGQLGLSFSYNLTYFAKAFTYDVIRGIGEALVQGGQSLTQAGNMEEILLAESEILGGVGAIAGVGAGLTGAPQIAAKIGSTTFTSPVASGSSMALATVTVPTGAAVAATMPGIGVVLMSAVKESSEDNPVGEEGGRASKMVETKPDLPFGLGEIDYAIQYLFDKARKLPAKHAPKIGAIRDELRRIQAQCQYGGRQGRERALERLTKLIADEQNAPYLPRSVGDVNKYIFPHMPGEGKLPSWTSSLEGRDTRMPRIRRERFGLVREEIDDPRTLFYLRGVDDAADTRRLVMDDRPKLPKKKRRKE